MVSRARDYCAETLETSTLWENSENRSTKKHYEELVTFANRFLDGGEYDICVGAYSQSNRVRIRVSGTAE